MPLWLTGHQAIEAGILDAPEDYWCYIYSTLTARWLRLRPASPVDVMDRLE